MIARAALDIASVPPAAQVAEGRQVTLPPEGISLDSVTHELGGRKVLDAISLRLEQPRIAVIGANGSGKTSFARCLNGLIVPHHGRVEVDGLDTRGSGPAVRRRVGYVFQNPDHQLILPTVAEDIGFGLQNQKRPRCEIDTTVAGILERFGIAHLAGRPIAELSGGEKRLVTILSVLVMNPRHLVLDEPSTGLDLRQRNRFASLIQALPQRIVLVTHDLDHIMGFDRVIAFDEGRVVLDGEPSFVVPRWAEIYG